MEFADVAAATAVHTTLQGALLTSSDRGPIRIQYSKNPYGKRSPHAHGHGASLSASSASSSAALFGAAAAAAAAGGVPSVAGLMAGGEFPANWPQAFTLG